MFYILEDIFNKWNNAVNTSNTFSYINIFWPNIHRFSAVLLKCSFWLSDKDESIAIFGVFPPVFSIKEIKENMHMVKKLQRTEKYIAWELVILPTLSSSLSC